MDFLPALKSLRALRALRALRPLRLVSRYPEMQLVVEAIFQVRFRVRVRVANPNPNPHPHPNPHPNPDQGSTVAELRKGGELRGHWGMTCGTLEGFDFHKMQTAAAYIMLVDRALVAGK